VATLESLLEQKRDLEDRLANGDARAEAALDRIDRAIMERKKTIAHSQQRVAAVKQAVAAGVPQEQARKGKPKGKKPAGPKDETINRFE
jgi:hypothetical protein